MDFFLYVPEHFFGNNILFPIKSSSRENIIRNLILNLQLIILCQKEWEPYLYIANLVKQFKTVNKTYFEWFFCGFFNYPPGLDYYVVVVPMNDIELFILSVCKLNTGGKEKQFQNWRQTIVII